MTKAVKANPSLMSDPGVLPSEVPVAPSSLSTRTFIGFSVGMIGDRIFRDAPALLLLIFMTNYLAIPPAIAGTAIFLPKIVIVLVDPMAGAISDRLKTRWGRRRPLMFFGAIVASVSLVLFFHVPRLGNDIAQAAYMSLVVLVGFTGYSFYSVPYLTMASEIAGNDRERRKIMSWRVVLMAVGLAFSAFAGGFMEWLSTAFNLDGAQAYGVMGWVYGGVCLVTMMATVVATAGIRQGSADQAQLSLAAQLRMVAGNRRYLRLLLVGFLQKLGEGVGYGSFAYFCIYVVHQPLTSIGLVVLASMAGQILTQPLWLRAGRRWSGPTLYTAGVLGWCVSLLLWLAMKGQSPLWLIPLGLEAGASAGGFLMITLAMLSNTMAADSAETGFNREGVYSGIWLAVEKLAFALGALVVGVCLGLSGFVESSHGSGAVQTPTAVLGIALTYCGVNMAIYLISIWAVRGVARRDSVTAGA